MSLLVRRRSVRLSVHQSVHVYIYIWLAIEWGFITVVFPAFPSVVGISSNLWIVRKYEEEISKKDLIFFRFFLVGHGNAHGWVLPSDRVSQNGNHVKLRFCIGFWWAYNVYYINMYCICIVNVFFQDKKKNMIQLVKIIYLRIDDFEKAYFRFVCMCNGSVHYIILYIMCNVFIYD